LCVKDGIAAWSARITSTNGFDDVLTIASTINGLPVIGIGMGAFANKDSITNVTIPNSVTSVGISAFYWCENLTSIAIPASVSSIGSSALRGCIMLKAITVEQPAGISLAAAEEGLL
jgi:hypothetical protein